MPVPQGGGSEQKARKHFLRKQVWRLETGCCPHMGKVNMARVRKMALDAKGKGTVTERRGKEGGKTQDGENTEERNVRTGISRVLVFAELDFRKDDGPPGAVELCLWKGTIVVCGEKGKRRGVSRANGALWGTPVCPMIAPTDPLNWPSATSSTE